MTILTRGVGGGVSFGFSLETKDHEYHEEAVWSSEESDAAKLRPKHSSSTTERRRVLGREAVRRRGGDRGLGGGGVAIRCLCPAPPVPP